jgi:epoxyqueuosine reductase QueG
LSWASTKSASCLLPRSRKNARVSKNGCGAAITARCAGWSAIPAQRTDPRLVFPAARSVVVVALNYYTPHEHDDDPATGKISRYAWGDDYHDVVGEKLRELLAWIKEQYRKPKAKLVLTFNR